MDSERTEISELGEFGLINHLSKHVKTTNSSTLKGIGDDAAVIDIGNGSTTDFNGYAS